ncbi:MAG: type VI secretion system lipoprotein TssJ [Chitinispirillaceae bacterium]|nr:type VI secretion system lipoprotein TssJ [Chitinispirillaceae bacterium]
MKRFPAISQNIWTLAVAVACCVCGRCTPPPQPDLYTYRAKGLQLDIRADQMLNSYAGEAHSLKLVIYQLSDNGAFIERQKSSDGLKLLLKEKKFDPTVVGYDQIIVHPNESRIHSFDRINQAKWVGIVAGFYCAEVEDDKCPSPLNQIPSVLVQIPSIPKKKSFIRRAGEFLKLLTPSDIYYVPQIAIQLMLTSQTIYETSVFR